MVSRRFPSYQVPTCCFLISLFFSCCCLVLFGCEQEREPAEGGRIDLNRGETISHDKSDTSLLFYNWEDYTGAETIRKFMDATGIELHLETFDDDEAIIGALQSGSIHPDIIIVSQSLAQEMLKSKLLQPIDYAKIPNSRYFKKRYTPEADEQGKRYWAPYLWGTTGIVVNTRYVDGDYKSWSVLWDPRYTGKIGMLNNGFEVTATASKMLGYSVNPTVEQLDEIYAKLLEQKELIRGYYSVVELREMMRDETLWAAQIYNGDGLMVDDEFDYIEFVNPREGTALWVDVFVIPRSSLHSENAHAFINFIHTPEILASIADEFWFASTNTAAEHHMSPEVLEAEEVYPSPEVLEKSEFFKDMGSGESVRKRVQIWSKLTGR